MIITKKTKANLLVVYDALLKPIEKGGLFTQTIPGSSQTTFNSVGYLLTSLVLMEMGYKHLHPGETLPKELDDQITHLVDELSDYLADYNNNLPMRNEEELKDKCMVSINKNLHDLVSSDIVSDDIKEQLNEFKYFHTGRSHSM